MKSETLQLGFFPKAYFFNMEDKWLVIEKERQVVCVYATGENNHGIFAAIPLCHPKYLKKTALEIRTTEKNENAVLISVADIRIVIDYQQKRCAINTDIHIYGSEFWGQDCSMAWTADLDALF